MAVDRSLTGEHDRTSTALGDDGRMTRLRRFVQVDVFGVEPLRGNPLAVVLDAQSLSDEQMQQVALWTNLSETTFVLPPTTPEADYRVRIFTPERELPFAGHPTLGTAHAWLEEGGQARSKGALVQECAAGLVNLRSAPEGLSFAAPPLLRSGPLDEHDLERICSGLGVERDDVLDHQWVDNGPGWAAIRLASAAAVAAVTPDHSRLRGDKLGLVGWHESDHEALYEVRAFIPDLGAEDPVTGSLNAGIAQWLTGAGQAPSRYRATQGSSVGRDGRVEISAEGGHVWVGGSTHTVVQGAIRL